MRSPLGMAQSHEVDPWASPLGYAIVFISGIACGWIFILFALLLLAR